MLQQHIVQYKQFIDQTFANLVSVNLSNPIIVARISPQLIEQIKTTLYSDGYGLVTSMLSTEFTNRVFDTTQAGSYINVAIQYAIAAELAPYQVAISDFASAVAYTDLWINTQKTVQVQPAHLPLSGQSAYYIPPAPVGSNNNVIQQQRTTGIVPMKVEAHVPSLPANAHLVTSQYALPVEPVQQPAAVVAPPVDKRPLLHLTVENKTTEVGEHGQFKLTNTSTALQLGAISAALEIDSVPFLTMFSDSFITPIEFETADNIIPQLGLISDVCELENIAHVVAVINDLPATMKAFFSTKITFQIMQALKFRYAITGHPGFPFISQFDTCKNYLTSIDAYDDIIKIVLRLVRSLLRELSLDDVKDNQNDSIAVVLAGKQDRYVLALPWISAKIYTEDAIRLSTGNNQVDIEDILRQAFAMLAPDVFTIEIVDLSLTRYSVYKHGKNMKVPNKFSIFSKE